LPFAVPTGWYHDGTDQLVWCQVDFGAVRKIAGLMPEAVRIDRALGSRDRPVFWRNKPAKRATHCGEAKPVRAQGHLWQNKAAAGDKARYRSRMLRSSQERAAANAWRNRFIAPWQLVGGGLDLYE
jgi:hypothetical protein